MLQDDILLTVKKDGVINAINVSTEGIVIDGNKVHITGDTVFDNNVIVGGMIAADSIALEHLKANSVSSAKIQADAITADKLAAGAVTADKIEAGAITAEKLAAGSVTSDAIQAGSVIGDKIAANSITADKFAVNAIVVGGDSNNVTINDGAIKAEKLNVQTLSSICATIGTLRTSDSGARVEIKDNLILVYDLAGKVRVKLGVW